MTQKDANVTSVYDLYERGAEHHNMLNMYRNCEKYHNFYIGDQWHGLKSGDEELPIFNFIKPVGKYKIALIAQNQMSIVYSAMGGDQEAVTTICKQLSAFAEAQWEKSKMDTLAWRVIKNAFITGDHYIYCYDDRKPSDSIVQDLKPKLKMRLIHKTNVYFSDEQNPELNEQEYIIIAERRPVNTLREIAKRNKVPQDQIELIVSDEETETQIGEDKGREVKSDTGKCTCILYMKKTDAGIEYSRSTKYVEYEPKKLLAGLDVYPLVGMRWEEKIGSARGESGVKYLIPNQLEVNKTAARRAIAVKRFAFPTMAYDAQKITNIDKLSTVGATISIDGLNGNSIDSVIQYLNPAPISSDAEKLQNETIDRTRELEGASDAATGQIDPTQASGEAIKAARDQAAIPLNEQIAAYKQFVEDIALLWYKLWVVYSPQGLQISYDDNGEQASEVIPADVLQGLDIDIKIDVSPVDPYSKISQQLALDRLLQGEYIRFEEYVNALDDTSSVPKAALQEILKDRMSEIPPEVIEQLQNNPDLLQYVMQTVAQYQAQAEMQGEEQDEMSELRA